MKILNAFATSTMLLFAVTSYAGEDIGPDRAVQLLQAGTIKSFEELNAAALSKHAGATIGDTELELENDKYVYSVELRDADGREWDVDVDATTGAVLSDREDN